MGIQNPPSHPVIKAGFIVGVSLVLGLLFDYFFYGKIPGIAFPFYVILVVTGLFAMAHFFKRQITKDVFWLLVPLIFFSAMVFVRSSELLTFLNVVASLLLLLVIARVFVGERMKNFLVDDYVKILFLPLKFIRPLFQTLHLFSRGGVHKDKKILSQVVKGIFMAIPVLIVFLLLFSSADLIFQKVVSDIITIDIEPETVFRSIVVLIATFVYIGAYSYAFRTSENLIAAKQNNKISYRVGHIESSILLGSVNVLFFVFILVQLTYLFGGAGNISSQGFTYAEYARRGFFELIAVAIVSFLLLLVIEKTIAQKETDHARGFKILSAALVIQVIVIMASAFTRLSLYEEAYGFTTLRLYSHALIILLAAIFCLLLYKITKDKRENAFAFRTFILLTLFLAAINFLNPDAFIARRNIERLATAGKLDMDYLSRLSDDAVPDMIELLDVSNLDLTRSVARKLYWRAQNNNAPYLSQWQSLNVSRMRAEKMLNSKMSELEPYKDSVEPYQ